MGTKNNPGQYDCYSKLEDDEPYFLLRGKDPVAASLVREWVQKRIMRQLGSTRPIDNPTHFLDKLTEAMKIAKDMEDYCINLHMSGGKAKKPGPPEKSIDKLRQELVSQGGYRSGRNIIEPKDPIVGQASDGSPIFESEMKKW